MRRLLTCGAALLVISSPAVGTTRAGVIVGPGVGLGDAMIIPDAREPDTGYIQEKATALSSVRNLLSRGSVVPSKSVKLYKFTKFPVPIADFFEADRSLLENCSPKPARSLGTHDGIDYFLVVMDCPIATDPTHQVAAAVGERKSKVISIVINTDVIPVRVPNEPLQPERGN